ncbi:MAG: glycosyltransferase, partial [Anaerolineae bacterium]
MLGALEAGLPVLDSALGGISDLVQHDVNGLLVQPCHEVDAWTAMLESLVAKPR